MLYRVRGSRPPGLAATQTLFSAVREGSRRGGFQTPYIELYSSKMKLWVASPTHPCREWHAPFDPRPPSGSKHRDAKLPHLSPPNGRGDETERMKSCDHRNLLVVIY